MRLIGIIAAIILPLCATSASAVSITNAEVRHLTDRLVAEMLPNCVGVDTFYDQVYCSSKMYFIFDETLNRTYSDLRKKLPKSTFRDLRDVQRVWVKQRDDQCARIDGDAVIMDLQCAIRMTVSSLWYLFEIRDRPLAMNELIAEYEQFVIR